MEVGERCDLLRRGEIIEIDERVLPVCWIELTPDAIATEIVVAVKADLIHPILVVVVDRETLNLLRFETFAHPEIGARSWTVRR
ncbi:MAG: hypothetical protein GEU99_04535 [Luteitalea sp.]|nr:hypothetical protein [Luteitalea sp.]